MIWKIRKIICSVFVFVLMSCSLNADSVPYLVSGEMVLDTDLYGEASFVFLLYNKSEKPISSFTLVFFLFDEDGNPPLSARSNIVSRIKADIEPDEQFESSFSLLKYLSSYPEYP